YLPFGESLRSSETIANPFHFVGQFGIMQKGNGLDLMRARFYSAVMGRFVTPDPIGISGGEVNFYSYVGQNPVSYVDPDGQQYKDSGWLKGPPSFIKVHDLAREKAHADAVKAADDARVRLVAAEKEAVAAAGRAARAAGKAAAAEDLSRHSDYQLAL